MKNTIMDCWYRWLDLPIGGQILAIPGLLMAVVILVIISPVVLIYMMWEYTCEVLGIEDDDDGGYDY